MTELEKMQRAKMYIDKLANGINPIDNAPAADSDIINNVRLSRCLFYVSGVLGQVIENNGVIGKAKASKKAFSISAKDICRFSFSETPIPVSEIAKRLNALVDLDIYRQFNHNAIASWLIEIGALEWETTPNGESVKRPTEQGKRLGISTETRTGMTREYVIIVYSKDAQQFILDNIEAILCHTSSGKKNTEIYGNQGQPWTPAHEECLIDLFNKDVPVSEIAATLKRSTGGIRAKLKKLGLIDNRYDAR